MQDGGARVEDGKGVGDIVGLGVGPVPLGVGEGVTLGVTEGERVGVGVASVLEGNGVGVLVGSVPVGKGVTVGVGDAVTPIVNCVTHKNPLLKFIILM